MFNPDKATVKNSLEYAIRAIEKDDLELGSAALEWVLEREPENSIAWLWMACTVDDENTRRGCFSKAQLLD